MAPGGPLQRRAFEGAARARWAPTGPRTGAGLARALARHIVIVYIKPWGFPQALTHRIDESKAIEPPTMT